MKLSIIIPVFNAEKCINRMLYSILSSQSREFEIICVDDGSTDNTKNVINEINDKRIMVLSKENGGTFRAWRYGLNFANGDFVTIVDQDDYVDDDYIDYIIDFICSKKADLLFTPYYVEQKNGHNYYVRIPIKDGLYIDEKLENIRPLLVSGKVPYAKFTKVIKRDVLLKQTKNTIEEKIHDFEDWLTMIEVFSQIHSIYIYNRPFYHYMQNNNSVSKSSISYKTNMESLTRVMSFLKKSEYSNLNNSAISSIYFYGLKIILNKCIKIKEYNLAKEIVKSKEFSSHLFKSDINFAEKIILWLRLIHIYRLLYIVYTFLKRK